MKTHDVVQGSHAWTVLRLGIPTASQFSRILTPKTRKLSASAADYRHELLAEMFLGHASSPRETGFMERGSALEAEARRYYEFQRDVLVERVGFVTTDSGRVGGSPDGLIGEDGGVEIKCTSASNHIAMLLGDGVEQYAAQCQGYMMLTGRAWWDLVAYNPELPTTITRFARDDEYIDALALALVGFLAALDAGRATLLALGCVLREPMTEQHIQAEAAEFAAAMPF